MTGRERVLAAFRGEKPDRVPCFEQSIASEFSSAILGREAHTGMGALHRAEVESWLSGGEAGHREFTGRIYRDLVELVRALEFDAVRAPWRFSRRPTARLNEFDYQFGEPGEPGYLVMRYSPDAGTFSPLCEPGEDPGDMEALEHTVERAADDWAARRNLPPEESEFRWLRWLREQCPDLALAASHGFISIPPQENWLMATALRPDLVEIHLDMTVEQFVRDLPVLAEIGVDFLQAGGDMASNLGPIYSPQVFRDLLLPRLRRIVDAAHEHGLFYVFRTDGVVWSVADDMFVHSGVDGYGEIDVAAGMDLLKVRASYPRLVLVGGVECGELLTNGSVGEVYAEARRVIEGLKPGGRHLMGSSNSVSHRVPPENYRAILRAARDFGTY